MSAHSPHLFQPLRKEAMPLLIGLGATASAV
jgi:hypothetical protein